VARSLEENYGYGETTAELHPARRVPSLDAEVATSVAVAMAAKIGHHSNNSNGSIINQSINEISRIRHRWRCRLPTPHLVSALQNR